MGVLAHNNSRVYSPNGSNSVKQPRRCCHSGSGTIITGMVAVVIYRTQIRKSYVGNRMIKLT